MSETQRKGSKIELGGLTHGLAGIAAIVLGGLMYIYPWALNGFAALMLISAVSAILISWRMDA